MSSSGTPYISQIIHSIFRCALCHRHCGLPLGLSRCLCESPWSLHSGHCTPSIACDVASCSYAQLSPAQPQISSAESAQVRSDVRHDEGCSEHCGPDDPAKDEARPQRAAGYEHYRATGRCHPLPKRQHKVHDLRLQPRLLYPEALATHHLGIGQTLQPVEAFPTT